MSDILIKGIKMPKNCKECFACKAELSQEKKVIYVCCFAQTDCPLIPVPPHGDLISREWLVDIGLHLMNTALNDDIANGVKWLWQYIIEAPTIIEAEEGQE